MPKRSYYSNGIQKIRSVSSSRKSSRRRNPRKPNPQKENPQVKLPNQSTASPQSPAPVVQPLKENQSSPLEGIGKVAAVKTDENQEPVRLDRAAVEDVLSKTAGGVATQSQTTVVAEVVESSEAVGASVLPTNEDIKESAEGFAEVGVLILNGVYKRLHDPEPMDDEEEKVFRKAFVRVYVKHAGRMKYEEEITLGGVIVAGVVSRMVKPKGAA